MKILFLLTPLFLLWDSTVQAQSDADFHRFDKNKDRIVTAKELPSARTRARFDQDGDGDVTLAEFQLSIKKAQPNQTPNQSLERIDAYIKQTDTNKDGQLSREEVGREDWFDRIDRDNDNLISRVEIARVRALVKYLGKRGLPTPSKTVTEQDIKKITSGPEILKPGEVGIGRMISDLSFTDIDGTPHQLADIKNHKGYVFAMTSATCPVSKRFLPSLAKLEKSLAAKDIPLFLVNMFASETEEAIRKQLTIHDLKTPYIHDTNKDLCRTLEATTTTEVFLIDSKRTLIYRGALDDQYGIDYNLERPKQLFLNDAIAAYLKNELPTIAATAAPGCEINYGNAANTATTKTELTYHREISRVLQRNCLHCHNDGGIAPFSLEYYDEVVDRARVIKRVIQEATMPPWFASQDETEDSLWANDHSLSTRDKADLLTWLDSDQKEGNPDDAPKPITFPNEWTMGKPDIVIPISKAYKIKASGFMPYQRDVVTTTLKEDKWVTGYEIRPSARDVVHHVIVQVFEPGKKVRNISESQGFWAAYVPGNGAVKYPKGFARKLPAGAKVHFQIHYTPSGEEKMERLKMGLHFSETPPEYEVKTLAVADRNLRIPPGASAHEEGSSRYVPFDMPALSFMAHMHVRGSAFSYELIHPDGKTEMLLDIPRYDFNWQLRYELKKPKILPGGSKVKVTALFDNSTNNRANPDPTKTVRWGDQTVDEMLIGYIEYFLPIGQ